MVIRIFLSRRPVKINKFPKKKNDRVIWKIQQKAAISQVTNGELERDVIRILPINCTVF